LQLLQVRVELQPFLRGGVGGNGDGGVGQYVDKVVLGRVIHAGIFLAVKTDRFDDLSLVEHQLSERLRAVKVGGFRHVRTLAKLKKTTKIAMFLRINEN